MIAWCVKLEPTQLQVLVRVRSAAAELTTPMPVLLRVVTLLAQCVRVELIMPMLRRQRVSTTTLVTVRLVPLVRTCLTAALRRPRTHHRVSA